MNAQNLDVLWRVRDGGPGAGRAALSDDEAAVYFGSTDGALYKFAAKTAR